MASNKKVITLGLDYSQFDGGITECNRKMKVLDSEFRAASEQAKSFGDETDQLTLKQQQLTEKINLQTQKLKISKEAYDKAIESGKTSDKQLDNLRMTYNNNEAALAKLNNELTENNSKLEKASKASLDANTNSRSFGSSIRDMASNLGVNVSPALETVSTKFDGMSQEMGAAVLGIGAIVTAFASCTIEAAKTADELLELSSVSGISTDQLQKLEYASNFVDVSIDTMTGSITKLTRNMDDARNGSKELEKAFGKLNIQYKDSNGELRNAEDVFYDTIDALGKVKNETERDALAMTLMGKSAKDLNPLIEAGSQRLKELGIEAEDMGLIVSGVSLNELGQFQDSMDGLGETFDAVKVKLGIVLLPVLQGLVDIISGIPAPVLAGVVVFGALVVVITLIAKAAYSMAAANAVLSASNVALGVTGTAATAGMGPLLLILLGIAAAIALIVAGAVGVKSAMSQVKESVSGITNASNTTIDSVSNASNQSYVVKRSASGNAYYAPKNNYDGTEYFEGGDTWVGEAGPELLTIPRGSRIRSNQESKSVSGDTYIIENITLDSKNVKELNDIIKIMQNLKPVSRKGTLEYV